jgi:protein SCO1/2
LWLLLLLLPLVASIAFLSYQATQVLPRLALAPAYSLTDENGEPLTSEEMRGKLVIYTLVPATCAAPCPGSAHTLQQLHQSLSAVDTGEIPLHFVTVYTSPEADTPESLRVAAGMSDLDSEQWHFVSSPAEQFSNILQANEQGAATLPDNAFVTPFYALVDGWGIVRAIYPTATPDLEQIQNDLRLVAEEANNSTGVNRYAYETVHLFMCHNGL